MGTLSLLKDVGVTWFREEDYPILLEILDDADKRPRSWNEWLKSAQQMEEWAKAQGYRTQRVYIPFMAEPLGEAAKVQPDQALVDSFIFLLATPAQGSDPRAGHCARRGPVYPLCGEHDVKNGACAPWSRIPRPRSLL